MEKPWDVIIVGGGVSGQVAAIAAARCGERVLVLEKLDRLGKKLLATGNGRCNLMNLHPPVYYGDSDFASAVLGEAPVPFLTDFWESLGLILRYDGEGRGYPCTFQAATVAEVLLAELKRLGVEWRTGQAVIEVRPCDVPEAEGDYFSGARTEKEIHFPFTEDEIDASGKWNVERSQALSIPPISRWRVHTASGELFFASRLILATGGAAQPKLGGNEDAFPWLRKLGHRMVSPAPALTPLLADHKAISGLAGLRVRGELTVWAPMDVREEAESLKEHFPEAGRENIPVALIPSHTERGEILFTEEGISGICVMQCARFVRPGSVCSLNLVPDLFPEEKDLLESLRLRRQRNLSESPVTLLRGLCAAKMAFAVCKQAGLPLRGETCGDLEEEHLSAVARSLRGYRIPIRGLEGLERAQVMAGGLDCGEVNPENMCSRRWPGLHITGELLNVDGDCGGYNLMFACASGLRAGGNGMNG